MGIEFNLDGSGSIALTEKCSDIDEFTKAVRSPSSGLLAQHLAHCPACRKVALDAVKALVSTGDPLEPPAPIKALASKIASSGEEKPNRITVHVKKGRVHEVEGGEYESFRGKRRIKLSNPAKPYPVVFDFEFEARESFLRIIPKEESDAFVTVKRRGGEPVGKPLKHSPTFPALETGRYLLSFTGKGGERQIALELRLDE